jgi:hypothetical protein
MRLQGRISDHFLFTNKVNFLKEMSNLENNYKLWEQVQETVGYINKINNFNPEYG